MSSYLHRKQNRMSESQQLLRGNGPSNRTLWCAFSLVCGMIYGYNVSIAPALTYVTKELNLSTSKQEIASASATLSDALSMLFGGRLADIYGRRTIGMVACVMSIFGTIMTTALSTNYSLFLMWRLCTGIGNGLSILILPMYITESAAVENRGLYIGLYQLGVVSGTVLPYAVILCIDNWIFCMAIGAVPALLILVGYLTIFPESVVWQNWSSKQGSNSNEVEYYVDLDREHNLPYDTEDCKKNATKGSYLELFLGILLAYANNSIDACLFYGPEIIARASNNYTTRDANLVGMCINALSVISLLIAMKWFVMKYSRRSMYLFCFGIVVLCFVVSSIIFAFYTPDAKFSADGNNNAVIALAITFGLLVMVHSCGPGVLFVLIISELFQHGAYRARYMSYCTFFMSLFSLLINGTLLSLFKHLGIAWTFAMYGFTYLVSWYIFYKYLPETTKREIMAKD